MSETPDVLARINLALLSQFGWPGNSLSTADVLERVTDARLRGEITPEIAYWIKRAVECGRELRRVQQQPDEWL